MAGLGDVLRPMANMAGTGPNTAPETDGGQFDLGVTLVT